MTVGNHRQVHEHVANANHGFQGQQLEAFRRERRIEDISQYLRGLNEALRRRVVEASARTLEDVGIRPEDLHL